MRLNEISAQTAEVGTYEFFAGNAEYLELGDDVDDEELFNEYCSVCNDYHHPNYCPAELETISDSWED